MEGGELPGLGHGVHSSACAQSRLMVTLGWAWGASLYWGGHSEAPGSLEARFAQVGRALWHWAPGTARLGFGWGQGACTALRASSRSLCGFSDVHPQTSARKEASRKSPTSPVSGGPGTDFKTGSACRLPALLFQELQRQEAQPAVPGACRPAGQGFASRQVDRPLLLGWQAGHLRPICPGSRREPPVDTQALPPATPGVPLPALGSVGVSGQCCCQWQDLVTHDIY